MLQGAADRATPTNLCNSTADEPNRLDSQHSDLESLCAFNFQGDGPHVTGVTVTKPRARAPSPEVRPAPIKSLPAPNKHRTSPLFTGGDNTSRSTVANNQMERAITSGLETGTQAGESTLPAPVEVDRTANIPGEGVNAPDDLNLNAPLVERHGDQDGLHEHTRAIEMEATQLPLAQREVGQVGMLPFGLPVNASMASYRGQSHDLDTESDLEDMQGGFSVPMDEDEGEVERSFGVGVGGLSSTTCDPFLAWHPHLHGHSLHTQQDDHVGEDNGPVDLAMGDAGTEPGIAIPSVTATKSLQPFSWIPPSASSAFHASFPGVPSSRFHQTAGLVSGPTHVMESPMPGNPFAMDMTVSDGGILQHTAPPPDITWPFVPNGTHLLPSVEVEMSKEPEHFIPRPSPTPVSSTFATQVTGHLSHPPTSSPRAGPVPAPPSTCRPAERHNDEVKGLIREVDPRLAVVDSVQHKTPPLRCVKSRLI